MVIGGESRAITGVGFAPGMVWLKNQTDTSNGFALDRVRGNTSATNLKAAFASSQDAESNHATQLKSLDSDGFTVGSGDINANNDAISAFAFKTPTTPVSNTDGNVTSQVCANVDAGFSWVGWTGTETSGRTIGHGLSQAPEWIILKARTRTFDYPVNIENVYGMSANQYMIRNSTAAVADSSAYFGGTPNATTFTVGDSARTNDDGGMIAWCFHSVPGFSQFGWYRANTNADGPYVMLNFRPSFLIVKMLDTHTYEWVSSNTASSPDNPADKYLQWNSNAAEQADSSGNFDLLSNGFKLRDASYNNNHPNYVQFLYWAMAETPFKYANAR